MKNRLSIDKHQCRSFCGNHLGLESRNLKISKISCYSLMKPARRDILVSVILEKHFLDRLVLPQVGMQRKRSRSLVLKITWEKWPYCSTFAQPDFDVIRCTKKFSFKRCKPHVSNTSLSKVIDQTPNRILFGSDTGICSLFHDMDLGIGMGEYDQRVLRPK